MSDWQFASKEGNLQWTTPATVDKGAKQILFSNLSPTLLIGYHQKGDLLPVDYVKLAEVTRVVRSGDRGITLEKPGATVLVLAESASEADDWYSMINMALQENDAAAGVQAPVGMGQQKPPAPEPPQAFSAPDQEQQQERNDRPPKGPSPVPTTRPTPSDPTPVNAVSPGQQQEQIQPIQPIHGSSEQQPGYQSLNQGNNDSNYGGDRNINGGGFSEPTSQQQSTEQQPIQPLNTQTNAQVNQQQQQSTNPLGVDQQGVECSNDPTGEHEFRPLSDVMGQNQHQTGLGTGKGAMATTTTQIHQEQRSSYNGNPAFNTNTSSVLGGSNPNFSSSMTRPLPSQSPIVSGPGDSVWGGNTSRLRSMGGTTTLGGLGTPSQQGVATPTGGRPRSGMLVSMPATQTVNRNIAPNMSAMWKEWEGPDGCTYLVYEPTGTMLRRQPGESQFEMFVEGTEELTDAELQSHPYAEGSTTANLNTQSVRNLQSYGHEPGSAPPSQYGNRSIQSPSVYRSEVVASPRGQYSPTRRTPVSALTAPRAEQAQYVGRRVHRVQLGVSRENPVNSVVQHEVETLGSQGMTWNKDTNEIGYDSTSRGLGGGNPGQAAGSAAIFKQWQEIRAILMRGRYFKKHALKTNTSQNRMIFLTSDNSYVCAVPTSAVLQNASRDPGSLANVAECVQYYGPDTRALALNEIQYVNMGVDEDFVLRKKNVNPEATFCIVSAKHAFVLECRNAEEAQFFHDAWQFFLYHSKPLNPKRKRTPNMIAPVTHGTRSGIQF